MIPIKINGADYNIPTKWEDVTWGQYAEFVNAENISDRFNIICGISPDLRMPLKLLATLVDVVSFTDEHADLPTLSKPYTGTKEVGQYTYQQIEKAKKAIQANPDNPMLAGAAIVKIYIGEDINDKPVTEVYNTVAFFLQVSQSS